MKSGWPRIPAPGTYTGDQIEELEEEVKRLREIERLTVEFFKASHFESGKMMADGPERMNRAMRRLESMLADKIYEDLVNKEVTKSG